MKRFYFMLIVIVVFLAAFVSGDAAEDVNYPQLAYRDEFASRLLLPAKGQLNRMFLNINQEVLRELTLKGLDAILIPVLEKDVVFQKISQKNRAKNSTWIGESANGEYRVLLTLGEDHFFGRVITGGEKIIFEPDENGIQAVSYIVDPAYEIPLINDEVITSATHFESAPVARSSDDGTRIDVMVLYTSGMADAHPGNQINTRIQNLIDQANQSFSNSNINTELNLVYVQEVDYPDDSAGGMGEALDALSYNEGVFSNIEALRTAYGADQVTLLRRLVDEGCGLAYLLKSEDPRNAYAVVHNGADDFGYFCSDLTYIHEVGHNLGCAHDRDNSGIAGRFSYSYGYQDPGEDFRTIMAYDCPGGCPEIEYFSNPNLTYNGKPIGIAGPDPDSADNARTINYTRVEMAGYRAEVAVIINQIWHDWFAVDLNETPMVGDFNGDGLTDIITFTRNNPSAVGDVYVALSDGTRFGDNNKWHDWFAISQDEKVVIGDYDGDGKDDIATWLKTTTKQVYVALSAGTGMEKETVWLNSIGFDTGDLLYSGDFDGDSLEDLVLFARSRGEVWVALSTGSGFSSPQLWHDWFAVSTYERPRVGDLNGDGMDDIITFATDSPSAQGDVYVAMSDGSQFGDNQKWHDWFSVEPAQIIRIGDLDGDLQDDFFTFMPPPSGQVYSVLSQGTYMAPNVLLYEVVSSADTDVPYVGDVNGDAKVDIIVFSQAEGKVRVTLTQ